MTAIRNSVLELIKPLGGLFDSSNDQAPKVIVINSKEKDDNSLWNCLRSKPCVCALLTFFVLELLTVAVVGLGIYLNYTKDGTLPCYLAPTNAATTIQTGEKFT